MQRVYDKYIKGKHAVILSVCPKPAAWPRPSPTTTPSTRAGYKAPDYGYAGLKYVKATDTFDRSKQPAAGTNPVVKVPALYQETLPNGLKVVGTKNTEIPAVTMRLTIRGGHRLEQAMPGKAGLAQLTASMLNEGSEKYTGEQFAAALDKLGSHGIGECRRQRNHRVRAEPDQEPARHHGPARPAPAAPALRRGRLCPREKAAAGRHCQLRQPARPSLPT